MLVGENKCGNVTALCTELFKCPSFSREIQRGCQLLSGDLRSVTCSRLAVSSTEEEERGC